jgi:hypothetical protein
MGSIMSSLCVNCFHPLIILTLLMVCRKKWSPWKLKSFVGWARRETIDTDALGAQFAYCQRNMLIVSLSTVRSIGLYGLNLQICGDFLGVVPGACRPCFSSRNIWHKEYFKGRYGLCYFLLYHGHYGFCEMSLFLIIRSLTMIQSSLCVD